MLLSVTMSICGWSVTEIETPPPIGVEPGEILPGEIPYSSLCLNSTATRTKTSMPSFIQDCSSVSSFRNAWYTTRASKNSQAAGRYFLRSIRRHKCSGASRSIFICAERTWRVYKCLSNCNSTLKKLHALSLKLKHTIDVIFCGSYWWQR